MRLIPKKQHRSVKALANAQIVDIVGLKFKANGVKIDLTSMAHHGEIALQGARALHAMIVIDQLEAGTVQLSKRHWRIFGQYLDHHASMGGPAVLSIRDVDEALLESYANWISRKKGWSYIYKDDVYKNSIAVIKRIAQQNKDDLHPEFAIPDNPFPGANGSGGHRKALSKPQFAQLKKAVMDDLQALHQRFERPYEPKWLGHPAPPVEEIEVPNGKSGGRRMGKIWTKDYLHWYFDNVLNSTPYTHNELDEMGESVFISAARRLYGRNKSKDDLERDEDGNIGEGEYVGDQLDPHSGLNRFYKEIGVYAYLGRMDLVAYLLMFCARTAINPTPLVEIRYDCIRDHRHDPNKKVVVWFKRRAGKWIEQPHDDSMSFERDDYPVALIERIQSITEPLRKYASDEDKGYLLLTGQARPGRVIRLTAQALKNAIRVWAQRKGLNFVPQPSRIRPAAGSIVFVLTKGDLEKVRVFLGKANLDDTVHYVRVSAHPDFIKERHHAGLAYETHLLGDEEREITDLQESLDVPRAQAIDIYKGGMDTLMGRCKNVYDSPIDGQEKGKPCRAAWACLVCRNHVIFPEDLWKIYSFYLYIEAKRAVTQSDEFNKFYAPFFDIVDKDITPKFRPETVAAMWDKARNDPFPAWDPALIDVMAELNETGGENGLAV